MTYIIFLVTIQAPFLYFIWKIFQKRGSKLNKNLQILRKQNEHIANFMDTLRMSVERISKDLYDQTGSVYSRSSEIEKEIQEIKKKFQQLEVYTGLNTSRTLEEINSSPEAYLKDKDFS